MERGVTASAIAHRTLHTDHRILHRLPFTESMPLAAQYTIDSTVLTVTTTTVWGQLQLRYDIVS